MWNGSYMGDTLFFIGVIAFIAVILFHAITLPVEFNASSRALQQMEGLGLIAEEEEGGAKKVLRAAAMTYVASLAMAVMNLIRILALRGIRDYLQKRFKRFLYGYQSKNRLWSASGYGDEPVLLQSGAESIYREK